MLNKWEKTARAGMLLCLFVSCPYVQAAETAAKPDVVAVAPQQNPPVAIKKIKLWDGLVLRVAADGKTAKANTQDVRKIKEALLAKIAAGGIPVMGPVIKPNLLEDAAGSGFAITMDDGAMYTFFIGVARDKSASFDFDENTRHASFLEALRTHIRHVTEDMGVSNPPQATDPLLGYIVAASPEYELAIMKWKNAEVKTEKFAQNKRVYHESGVMFEYQVIWEDPFQIVK
ncbi:MAG: hypothetical protein PHP45_08130 [Elusimicrobiales bacterium]|nr:hypothetical protein [Elusimicrobiales bacterium]